MSYKKFVFILWGSCLLAMLTRLFLAWLIDPIGIWGAPIVRGFNHYKIKQSSYLDVFKPYEYMREKPDILYIGASQMYVGFEPCCASHPEKKVYTLGLSALSLSDMREYLRFVYKVHKPEIIYIGVSPGQFVAKIKKRNGYSEERLERLAGNSLNCFWQAVEDTLSLHDICFLTVKASCTHKEEALLFLKGWDTKRGRAEEPDLKNYYYYIGQQMVGKANKSLDRQYSKKDALDCWKTIVDEAREAGVSLVPFFTPVSIDTYAIAEVKGNRIDWQYIKREAAKVTPMYDFTCVSILTTNRSTYFYDSLHFRASLGEKLKSCFENGNPAPYGYLLTPETIDAALAAEDEAWEKWRAENAEYVQALTEYVESGRKAQVGDFAKYIGF